MTTTTNVSSGVTSTGIALNNGDIENIFNGGTAVATTVSSGGVAHVSSGGIASQTDVFNGGSALVLHGGSATATIVHSGGNQIVSSGGLAIGTTVSRGGSEFIFLGGVTSNTTVSSGGTQFVDSGKASGTTVVAGGTLTVQAGGIAFSATVHAGAKETVNGVTSFTHLTNGAVEDVFLAAVGTVVDSGATELVDNFFGTDGIVNSTLVALGGTIDVTFLPFAAGGTTSFTSSTRKLTVSQGGHTYSQTLSGSYTGLAFELVSDGGSGTNIVVVACFRRGSRISMAAGSGVAIENLRAGDRVLTIDGPQPIVWIGHRAIDCQRHPAPHLVWPVRICAHAFGPGLPRRDLWLSPDHALFIDGALIPVKHLIDGDAIAQVPVTNVEYWHVELPRHAVLLAEGLPAESYLSIGDRGNFANGGSALTLHPDFASRAWEARGCAPLVVGGPLLQAARALIARRNGGVGKIAAAPLPMRRGRRQAILPTR